jgi:glycogen synthase
MGDNTGHFGREALHILMTTDAVGGVWQYSIDLSASLAARGAQVTLATLGPPPSSSQKQQAAQVSRLKLIESDFALEWMPNRWQEVDASAHWLLQLASELRPDVIHLNGYSNAALGWGRPVLVTAHSCVYSWWHAVHDCAPGDEWLEYHRRVHDGLARAHVIVAPSGWMAAELEREYGIDRSKVEIVHNFSRAHFDPAEKRPLILAAGRVWDKAKNLGMLEEIAPKLDWAMRIAGSSTTTHAGLPHSELLLQMQQAAILAHPALYEPFGLTILEAARARCCLVLSDIPSLRELWDGAAVFLDAQDSNAWLSELNALAHDSARRLSLADRAHRHASKYDTEASVGKYLRLYNSLLDSPRHAGKDVAA